MPAAPTAEPKWGTPEAKQREIERIKQKLRRASGVTQCEIDAYFAPSLRGKRVGVREATHDPSADAANRPTIMVEVPPRKAQRRRGHRGGTAPTEAPLRSKLMETIRTSNGRWSAPHERSASGRRRAGLFSDVCCYSFIAKALLHWGYAQFRATVDKCYFVALVLTK